MPPAPGLLTTTIVWPSSFSSVGAIARASASDDPPGGYGTSSSIDRIGNSWAMASDQRLATRATAAKVRLRARCPVEVMAALFLLGRSGSRLEADVLGAGRA